MCICVYICIYIYIYICAADPAGVVVVEQLEEAGGLFALDF